MNRIATSLLVASLFACGAAFAQVKGPGKYFVFVEQTDERLEPAATGKSTNVLRKRQAVDVLEVKGGWARVTKFYDGGVEGVNGQVARWVAVKDLSPTRPADETAKKDEPEIAKLLTTSDDFARHRKVFIKASQDLIDRKQCTAQDFKDIGGWSKSTNFANRPVYFMYCGGMTKANRVYVDASTGETFR